MVAGIRTEALFPSILTVMRIVVYVSAFQTAAHARTSICISSTALERKATPTEIVKRV
jgi:hypothetical protein